MCLLLLLAFWFFKLQVAKNIRHSTRPLCKEGQHPKCLRARGCYAVTVGSDDAIRAILVLKV